MDQQVVDAIKAAGKPFVPIVGADRGGFVEPAPRRDRLPGPRGRGRHQHRRRRRRGRRPGAQAPQRRDGPRPTATPAEHRAPRAGRRPTTRRRGQGPARVAGSVDGLDPTWPLGLRSTAGRPTPPSRPSPARARASSRSPHADHCGGCRLRRHPRSHLRHPGTDDRHRHRPPARGHGHLEDLRRRRGAAGRRRSPCARARSTRSWAPTAPARARSSRSSPAPSGPTRGTIAVRGRERTVHSPAEARRGGLVSVYQEPALIPDLDIRSNLRLTETPVEPFRHWLGELGLEDLDLSSLARRVPLASLRIIDLARALAIEPDVLMLDEMTAALPANLTERVLEVIGRQRGGDRSVIFISHRMIEIAAVCDRATVLREGETVGVVDVTAGSEERIVELMLGEIVEDDAGAVGGPWPRPARAAADADAAPGGARPGAGDQAPRRLVRPLPGRGARRRRARGPGPGRAVRHPRGLRPPERRRAARGRRAVSFRHPADAIRAGLVYVAADRAEALLMQRSVRENIALPFTTRMRRWGPINLGARADEGRRRRSRRSRSTPARQGEVRRLSGGNQQKVTIARWVAGGVRTMLCFDPTRGIDIRTKHQIYVLLRDLAEAGAAVLLYTSELKEVQLVCDRAIVIFGGRVVAEIAAADADEPALLRAAYNLQSDAVDARGDRGRAAADARAAAAEATRPPMSRGQAARPATTPRRLARSAPAARRGARRNAWTLGPARLPRRAARVHQAHPAELRRHRHPGPRDLGAAARPRGRRPRRSSSSPAGSTSRSAR